MSMVNKWDLSLAMPPPLFTVPGRPVIANDWGINSCDSVSVSASGPYGSLVFIIPLPAKNTRGVPTCTQIPRPPQKCVLYKMPQEHT